MWQVQIFTLYPEFFPGPLSKGLYGKALEKKIWNLKVVNIRDAADDKHKTVDDTPFGGGAGMLLNADILAKYRSRNTKCLHCFVIFQYLLSCCAATPWTFQSFPIKYLSTHISRRCFKIVAGTYP